MADPAQTDAAQADPAQADPGAEPQCPIRPGEPCHLCQCGSGDPETCGLVYLVMSDPELHEALARLWQAHDRMEQRRIRAGGADDEVSAAP